MHASGYSFDYHLCYNGDYLFRSINDISILDVERLQSRETCSFWYSIHKSNVLDRRSFNLLKMGKTIRQISVNMTRFMIPWPKTCYFRDV